jgi:hypothetical protein
VVACAAASYLAAMTRACAAAQLAAIALAASACLASAAPAGPGMSAALHDRIRSWYAGQWGCDATLVSTRHVGDIPAVSGPPWSIYEYACKGHARRVFTTCEAVDACSEWTESIEPRAAFDLGCDAAQLKLLVLDERSIGVEGCGRRATYVSTLGGGWEKSGGDAAAHVAH